ncbi:hypothetical protein LOK49_LG09G01159 [Camellia lanceoleosa]|uniref:Uncharacterized protein n=1 Tax=Camellia lanceoleosa TaxID=1840588 RepID=A0ACC0GJE1_9ERIC|nr:hypothetical protein LOK49_LG09G01159 [Camellia lanceoleosa]
MNKVPPLFAHKSTIVCKKKLTLSAQKSNTVCKKKVTVSAKSLVLQTLFNHHCLCPFVGCHHGWTH